MREFGGTVAEPRLTLAGKLWNIDWLLVSLLGLLAGMGVLMLYSAAEGRLEPWAGRQIVRFGAGAVTMIAVALVDIRFWLRWAYLIYAVAIVLLAVIMTLYLIQRRFTTERDTDRRVPGGIRAWLSHHLARGGQTQTAR